ncbi:MAG TPA: hypothetical protein VFS67_31340 [Polyangiaceae bacterium]|nr:hypothetical protein [Polyangiaceae bacterium]
MKYLRWSALVTLGLAFSGALINCQGHDVSTLTGESLSDENQTALDRCIPGQTFQCRGGCGAPRSGYQVCAADGRSLGPCVCPSLGTTSPGSSYADGDESGPHIVSRGALVGGGLPAAPNSSGFGSGSSSGVSTALSVVGAGCHNDADCGNGLGCITAGGAQLAGSGPAGGYCSASCGSDAACQAIDPGSRCIGLAGQNVCARTCESRDPRPGLAKCLNRDDLACVSVAAQRLEPPGDGPQAGLCIPVCQSDAQCGPGLFCNLSSGLCSSQPPAGDPLGSPCTGPDSCAGGVCLPLGDGFESVCSAFCRFGAPGCGFDDSAAQPGAGCVFSLVAGEGAGDRGLCLTLCQTALDCHETGAVCIPIAEGSDTRTCVVRAAPAPDPGAPGTGVPIGSECSGDEDCAGGICLSAEGNVFGLGGGFPGGYCSVPCTNSCAAGAVCVGTSPDNRHCLKACSPGPLGGDCGERPELSCNAFSDDPTRGFCLADCNLGGECGDRVCSPNLGLCSDAPPGGGEEPAGGGDNPPGGGEEPSGEDPEEPPVEPVPECAQDEDCSSSEVCEAGECVADSPLACVLDDDCTDGVCDPSTSLCIAAPPIPVGGACSADGDCVGGLCLALAGTQSCSAVCVWGTDQGCENYGVDAFCVLPLPAPNDDLGVCTELCNTADDCVQAGFECVEIGVTISGRTGTCLPPAPASPEEPPAPPGP